MRHCSNESVNVYEHDSKDFADLMREVASEADVLTLGDEYLWYNVHVTTAVGDDGGVVYRATLYVHA